ncbi:MAG: hypothetical protein ABI832_09025 [bacterium]
MQSRWYLWALPVVTLAAFGVLALWFEPQVQAAAGGLLPFDLRVTGYSLAEARAFLTALTPDGLALYQGPVRATDTLVPILCTLTVCLPVRYWHWGWTLPALTYGLLDLAENLAVSILLKTGPTVEAGPVMIASTLTMAKFAAFAVAALIALWGLWQARRWQR